MSSKPYPSGLFEELFGFLSKSYSPQTRASSGTVTCPKCELSLSSNTSCSCGHNFMQVHFVLFWNKFWSVDEPFPTRLSCRWKNVTAMLEDLRNPPLLHEFRGYPSSVSFPNKPCELFSLCYGERWVYQCCACSKFLSVYQICLLKFLFEVFGFLPCLDDLWLQNVKEYVPAPTGLVPGTNLALHPEHDISFFNLKQTRIECIFKGHEKLLLELKQTTADQILALRCPKYEECKFWVDGGRTDWVKLYRKHDVPYRVEYFTSPNFQEVDCTTIIVNNHYHFGEVEALQEENKRLREELQKEKEKNEEGLKQLLRDGFSSLQHTVLKRKAQEDLLEENSPTTKKQKTKGQSPTAEELETLDELIQEFGLNKNGFVPRKYKVLDLELRKCEIICKRKKKEGCDCSGYVNFKPRSGVTWELVICTTHAKQCAFSKTKQYQLPSGCVLKE